MERSQSAVAGNGDQAPKMRDWILGGTLVGLAIANSQHMILMPAEQIEFLDTWHVSGLQGTGSIDYEVSNLTLPDSHIVGFGEQRPPRTPLYQFPQFTLQPLGSAPSRSALPGQQLTNWVGLAQSKKRINSTSTLADRAHSHLEVARAEAALRSARAFLLSVH